MQISVFGLGYVGAVTAACLSEMGNTIIGVDVNEDKVQQINQGRSPIQEPGVSELVNKAAENGLLRATVDVHDAVDNSMMAIICVGTPSKNDGSLDLHYVEKVISELGSALKTRNDPFYIIIRSTIFPGTIENHIIPILEQTSGKIHGSGYWVLFHPEFLREGNAVEDYFQPPKIVIGEIIEGTGQILESLYSEFNVKVFTVPAKVAESVKYADNAYHALKITFANEIGKVFHSAGVESREVMDIFVSDTKLNISKKYLRPGFAFGGSCLSKDLRAIISYGSTMEIDLPLLEAILRSNRVQIHDLVDRIKQINPKNIALYGLAFKENTDDLRESPLLELSRILIDEGFNIRIYDPLVFINNLVGANKIFLERMIPKIEEQIIDSHIDICNYDLVIVGHPLSKDRLSMLLSENKKVMDLVGNQRDIREDNYSGIYWR